MPLTNDQKNTIDNALLLLSFQEQLIVADSSENDWVQYSSLLTFKETASASFLLSSLLLRFYAAEAGKSPEEIIQFIREQLLHMSIQN